MTCTIIIQMLLCYFPLVFSRQCTRCDAIKEYDGAEHGVVNMQRWLVRHEVLQDFMKQFLTEGYVKIGIFGSYVKVDIGLFAFSLLTSCYWSQKRGKV